MLSKLFKGKWGKDKQKKAPITYDDAKTLAEDSDEDVRMQLAARDDVAPELLYFLAEDPSPKVRQNVAANSAAPGQADLLLVQDKDTGVRESLARKVARLSPGLNADEQDKIRKMAYQALESLAKDQAVTVRKVLAETLKEIADAPPDVIRRLAWDVEAAVSTPVLRYSPVLNDQDLLDIIAARPSEGAISAISGRDHVSEDVSQAVVESDDVEAIGLLLGNPNAMIREQTLDRVIDMAVDVDFWHLPLAMRPKLPSAAAIKIARFVAEDILIQMVERDDLSAEILDSVRDVVHKRLGNSPAGKADEDAEGPDENKSPRGVSVDDDTVFDQATQMWANGELDEQTVIATIEKGEKRLACAMIAVMINFPLKSVIEICEMKSPKSCTAIAWKAGMSAKNAETVQRALAGIRGPDVIKAVDGEYAMSADDLEWQLEFMQSL